MVKHRVTVGLAAGAVAVGLLAAVPVGTAAAAEADMVLRAVQKQTKDTDIGPSGPSVGDRTVFSEDLYRDGRKVGTDGVECVITRVVKSSTGKVTAIDSQCVGTMRLGRGQITVQGLVAFNVSAVKPLKLVITGGTGFYKGARGEMTVEPTNDAGTRSKLTFDMTVG